MAYNTFSFPKQHFIPIALFSTLYMVINLIWSLTIHVIYKPIDWVSVMSYVLSVGAFVLSYLMHWVGRLIFEKYKKNKMENRIMEGLMGSSVKKEDAGG